MTKTDRYRIALSCVARGYPRWRLLPLEMLSMCTCYSQLHQRWFGYVSPCYWTTRPSLVLAHFRFLMDHMSGPYCSTCLFSIGTRVMLRLGHVSFLHWTMCRILLVHVAISYSTMCHDAVHPCFIFYSSTWLDDILPCVGFLIAHVSCSGYFTCHALVPPRVAFLFDHVAYSGSTAWSTINSSQK